jgi:hypothetical protein
MLSGEEANPHAELRETMVTENARIMAVQRSDRDPILKSLETPLTNAAGDIDSEKLRHRLRLSPADRIRENDRFSRFLQFADRCIGIARCGRRKRLERR